MRRPALAPGTFVQQFRAPGVAATQTCAAAFRQLVLHARPVVARALGCRPGTATCTSSAPTEPGTATGHPLRELSAAQRRPGSTLVPVP